MNWQRSETNNGIPYYVNHMSETTQWDHPKLIMAITDIRTLDNICYTAYRSAMKLRHIQKVLRLDLVELSSVSTALTNLMPQTSTKDVIMDAYQLRNVVHEIFQITMNGGRNTLNIHDCSDLLVSWILNVYDRGRTGYIFLKSFETAIVALCAGRILQKYKYLFRAFCFDGSSHMSKQGLEKMIRAFLQITDFLRETANLGASVSATVNSCLSTVSMGSVSQDEFVSWIMSEPQTLIWLPTLHRLSAAETVKHEAKCNICKCYPMVGFRYQCLKCLNFDICQTCFLTGRSSKHHRYTHPIQEYCLVASSRDEMKAFARTVRNKISKKHGRRLKLKYLAIEDDKQNYGQDHQNYQHDDQFQTHLLLGQLSKQLAAVEADPGFGSKVRTLNQEVMSKQKQDSNDREEIKLRGKYNLVDLINALDKENENLAAELGNYYQEIQEKHWRASAPEKTSSSSSSSFSSREHEERRVKQDILEEHNKRLEEELFRYKELIGKERQFFQIPNYRPAPLDKTALPRLEPYGQSEPQLDKIGTSMHNHHSSIGSRSSVPVPVTQQSFFRSSTNHTVPTSMDYGVASYTHAHDGFPTNSPDAPHCSKPEHNPHASVVNVETTDYGSLKTPGAGAQRSRLNGPSFQTTEDQQLPSVMPFGINRVWPPHLADESTVRYPNMSGTRVYPSDDRVWPPHLADDSTVRFPDMSMTRVFPSDEAKLDEMVEKMTAALDRSNVQGTHEEERNTICAVDRLGEAMQQLVSEINMATRIV